jgi:hypothetical protein
LAAVSALAASLSGCANWDYTMIRDEFQKCNDVASNRLKAGDAIGHFQKTVDCGSVYSRKLIDRFGTDDPSKINVEPFW